MAPTDGAAVNGVEAAGANLFENGLIINYTPDADGLDACESLGERFANA